MIHDNASAREQIIATLSRLQDAENQCRPADVVVAYADHGLLELDGRLVRGRRGVLEAFERLRRRPAVAGTPSWPGGVIRQATSVHVEFVSPTEARSSTFFVATSALGSDHTGSYADRFVLDAAKGTWLIAHRAVSIDSAAATSGARGVRHQRRGPVAVGSRPAVAGPAISRRTR